MKKIISIIVALMMLASLCTVMALNTSAAWGGTVAASYAGGTGTEADPYLISSAAELAFLASNVNGGEKYVGQYFKLTADVDLGEIEWDPIGNYANSTEEFHGHFDGAGHTVSGLKIDASSSYRGLFGRIVSATVKNLNVKGPMVSGYIEAKTTYVGGIVAYGINGTQIINCTADIGLVKGTTVGGIVGRMQNTSGYTEWSKVNGCFFTGKVEGINIKNSFVGGIVGVCGATVVSYCGNEGDVASNGATSAATAGGILGCQGAESVPAHVYNCYNHGNISAISTSNATYAGGIVGRAAHVENYAEIAVVANCFSTTKPIVTDAAGSPIDGKYGSIAGHIRYLASIKNCYTSIPLTEMSEVGTDDLTSLEADSVTILTEDQMKGADAVATMKLNEAWIAGSGYPTIDAEKAQTTPNEVPATEETTPAPEETTTPAPEVTTPAPEETTTPAPEVTTPAAEETTPAPTEDETTPAPTVDDTDDNQGGGSKTILFVLIGVVAVGAVVAIVIVVVSEKKKAK